MPSALLALVPAERGRAAALCAALIVANAAAWGWAAIECHGDAVLLGAAVLAYVFGLRHAVDADHIAAIDNATRKLIEAGRPAIATGCYFSLGHATAVVVAALATALAATQLRANLAPLLPLAGATATLVSAFSLAALAMANCVILVALVRLWRAARAGAAPAEAELARLLARRGLLGRLLRGLFGLIAKSWHMYPLGFLFALGFDTASEVGVLGASAAQATHAVPLALILVFPALFAAGMVLVDTLDAVMMTGAYRWAAAEPLRKLAYNMAVTLLSVVAAAVIGGIELLGLCAGAPGASGGVWAVVENIDSGALGAAIIVLFALAWLFSVLVWRARAAPS